MSIGSAFLIQCSSFLVTHKYIIKVNDDKKCHSSMHGETATLRFIARYCDMPIFFPYKPSRQITVSTPFKNFTVGKCILRSNAIYLLGMYGTGPSIVYATERTIWRPTSPTIERENGKAVSRVQDRKIRSGQNKTSREGEK